ncbi:MAG: LysM peptidoglycan-binding domain-containing protein [Flavobacteriales bacterium]|nr:LysM peptidoglycan-binding domain-containing protein [Flavobacteriales bacterium]
MRKIIITIITLLVFQFTFAGNTHLFFSDSIKTKQINLEKDKKETESDLIQARLKILNEKSPIDLVYNKAVENSINAYLKKNKKLVSRMVGLAPHYFPMFESCLDKYDIPLEFKYLAIVESALNPRARSRSGAKGLWQFMYATGKQYNLNVTSYLDERQDPYKSTEAACQYFAKLYEMFGDWNLVLAAYNGGPGYLSRTMTKTGLYDYWQLRPYLRRETRGYVPAFVAVNYVMNFYQEHGIEIELPQNFIAQTDTITLKTQIEFSVLAELICISKEIISQLNPSITKGVFPKNTNITLPYDVMIDFVVNEQAVYTFAKAVEQKEILINETRFVYVVKQGDYLGKIAQQNGVPSNDIRKWNKLKNDKLIIGTKLVLFLKDDFKTTQQKEAENPVYIIKQGDTLWDIANKYEGISVNELIKHNNLNPNQLKPGEKILLPTG